MQAYFTASITGKAQYLANYLTIIDLLKKHGVDVVSEHIIKTEESEIHMSTREKRLEFQKKIGRWIDDADFMIVEATFPSISVGYEISLAMQKRKPILALYSHGEPPSLIFNNEEDKIVCEKYTPDTIDGIISDFLQYVKGDSDTRFTFFISSDMASHLTKRAKIMQMPKSVYLRNLIVKDMEHTS